MKGKKITLATFKSFVRKNKDKLYIKIKSSFDGRIDCVAFKDNSKWSKPIFSEWAKKNIRHTLGIQQIWLVLGGRDYFDAYDDGDFTGIEVYNSCGYFIVAVKK